MGVSARELMLVLRARDEASRILRGLTNNVDGMSKASQKAAQKHIEQGQALIGVGAGIAFAGAAGLKWLNDSTDASVAYNQQAAQTLTQVDKIGVSLEDVKKIGMDLARTIPVPFEEIQGGLYDIFSSMDVTVPQAKRLLTEFSKAAVAGQVDLQTASKGTIAILNAWHMPATEVNRVNDVMFQLVRKGVGTYKDFSNAIGRAIPSTVRAGGSIQDLAGMMAFMTRNGLSTAQAATSAGRAFDAMSNPKTEKHMKEIGLSVKNAKGEFKPMTQVIQELSEHMKNMTAPQRAKALQALFLGSGGTIQARRFFDLAIPGYKQFNSLTGEMVNSSGAMGEAYDIMFQQPQSKIQLMTNKYNVMKVQIGDQLLPVKMKLVEAGMKLLDMWNQLAPSTQKHIAIGAAIAAVLLVVVGVLVIVVGGILLLMGAAAAAGVALGTVIGIVAAVIAILVGLVLIVVNVWHHWDDLKKFTSNAWTGIKVTTQRFASDMKAMILAFIRFHVDKFRQLWSDIRSNAVSAWNGIIGFLSGIPVRMTRAIIGAVSSLRSVLSSAASGGAAIMRDRLNSLVTWLYGVPGRIRRAFGNAGGMLAGIGRDIMNGLINGIQNQIGRLQGMLSNITNMIPDWKGPEAVDRKLLYKAGQLTLQGYGEGVESQIPLIKSMMKSITAQVPSMMGSGGPVVSAQPRPGGAPTSDDRPGVTQNFHITTQEIDPKKHSADLGFLLAKRLG